MLGMRFDSYDLIDIKESKVHDIDILFYNLVFYWYSLQYFY